MGGSPLHGPRVGRQDVQAPPSPRAPAALPGGTQASLQDGRQTQAGGVQSGPGHRLRAREPTSVLRRVRKPPWFVRNRGALWALPLSLGLEGGPGGQRVPIPPPPSWPGAAGAARTAAQGQHGGVWNAGTGTGGVGRRAPLRLYLWLRESRHVPVLASPSHGDLPGSHHAPPPCYFAPRGEEKPSSNPISH